MVTDNYLSHREHKYIEKLKTSKGVFRYFYNKDELNAFLKDKKQKAIEKTKDIIGYDERDRRDSAAQKLRRSNNNTRAQNEAEYKKAEKDYKKTLLYKSEKFKKAVARGKEILDNMRPALKELKLNEISSYKKAFDVLKSKKESEKMPEENIASLEGRKRKITGTAKPNAFKKTEFSVEETMSTEALQGESAVLLDKLTEATQNKENAQEAYGKAFDYYTTLRSGKIKATKKEIFDAKKEVKKLAKAAQRAEDVEKKIAERIDLYQNELKRRGQDYYMTWEQYLEELENLLNGG